MFQNKYWINVYKTKGDFYITTPLIWPYLISCRDGQFLYEAADIKAAQILSKILALTQILS